MSVFDLDTKGQDALAEQARLNPIAASEAPSSAFSGLGKGIGSGVMRGGARVGQFLGMAAGGLLANAEFGSSEQVPLDTAVLHEAAPDALDPYFRQVDDYANNAVDHWTPSHAEVGKAGQVLGGFSEIVLPLMAGAGNPALLVGSQEMGQATDLSRMGVDPETAVAGGVVQGAATAAGFRLPFLGSTLATRLASGAAGNLAVNTWATATTRAWLDSAGHKELAAQYDPTDLEARSIDVLSGIAFGAIEHAQAPRMKPSDVEAVAAANNAKHFQRDTAPGTPADTAAAAAHQDALETAINQTLRGDPVSVPVEVTEAGFHPRERDATAAARIEAARDEGLLSEAESGPGIPVARDLPAADRIIESSFGQAVAGDVDAAIRAYSKLPESEGGKILNTDTARELSPDYVADRTKSAAVHEPASWLVKEMYARRLAEAPRAGEEPLVVFSAGGTGAGKTSGLSAVPEVVQHAQIIYDTNMNKLSSAVEKIDQALAAGKDVHIVYTYRGPIEALTGGALPRAMKQEKKHGSGRTVPVDEHIGTHVGSRTVIEQIAAHYADDSRVTVRAIDNSHGKGAERQVDISEIPKPTEGAYTSLREQALEALDSEHAAGRISDAVYRGFAGEGSRPEAGSARGPDHAGDRREPAAPESGSAGVDDPLTASVRASLAEADFRIPTGDFDADGNAVTRSAREALAEADAAIAQAEVDGKGIMAAVTCFLQRGA